MSKIVLFIFAGREENMTVQAPYLHRLLDTYPEMEVHLWDLTRRKSDQVFLNEMASSHPRIVLRNHLHKGHPIRCMYPGAQVRRRGYPPCRCMLHKPPYEQPYQWYAEHADRYQDTVFVKVDDDVLFLETDWFPDLIDPLAEHPDRVYSANVINNAVCAKYAMDVGDTQIEFNLGSPNDPESDKDWWELHTYANFARWSHDRFLAKQPENHVERYVKTREGEAVSINCIAFSFQTMQWLADEFKNNPRLGDEGAVDSLLPWIALNFQAAHLSFGPQEKALGEYELNFYRDQYTNLRKGYLGE